MKYKKIEDGYEQSGFNRTTVLNYRKVTEKTETTTTTTTTIK